MNKYLRFTVSLFVSVYILALSTSAWSTNCPGATVILPASLPIVNQALTCGLTNDISTATISPSILTGGCSNGNYYGGQEALYVFTPTSSGNYDVSYL